MHIVLAGYIAKERVTPDDPNLWNPDPADYLKPDPLDTGAWHAHGVRAKFQLCMERIGTATDAHCARRLHR